jgi:hypothetical protein
MSPRDIPSGKRGMMGKGPEERAFFARFEPAKQGPPLYFWGRGEALAVLIRSLLFNVEGPFKTGRIHYRKPLRLLAGPLVSGRSMAAGAPLLRGILPIRPFKGEEVESALEVAPPPPPAEAAVEPPPPREPEPGVSQEVAEAQAEALKEAAESGAAICED